MQSNQQIYPKVGVGVLLYNKQGQVLLGKRLHDHGIETWGPPGGHLEFGESFEQCAIRETLEEIGVSINNPKFYAVTNDIFINTGKHYVSVFMQSDFPENQTVMNMEPHKVKDWTWFDKNNLPENLFLPLINLLAAEYSI